MLVDPDLRPQQTVYYATAIVMKELRTLPVGRFDLATIFDRVVASHNAVSIDAVVLALDFLYLLGLVNIDADGELRCI